MSYDNKKICPLCAWRENCAKRFAMGGDVTLHCPDFSEDIRLRSQREKDRRAEAGKPTKEQP